MGKKKVKLVLCWHMHQPHYRDGGDGQYQLPWVYLHAIKDYTDMVWHLEKCPEAKVVVNFAPVLLEQLDDYADQIARWLENGSAMQDRLLNLLAGVEPVSQDLNQRQEIAIMCQKAHAPTIIHALPYFHEMVELLQNCDLANEISHCMQLSYLDEQFFIDLLMWYHLAWMGISLRRDDHRITQLMEKKGNFSADDRRLIMQILYDAISNIIPRYKALLKKGQIELSMSPYGHPIVPLMIDFKSLKDSTPEAPMPIAPAYPDGKNRAKWHLQKGQEVFQHYFAEKPKGVWLSEGAVSEAAVKLLDEFGFQWTASGEGVWRHSCEASQIDRHDLHSKKALYGPMRNRKDKCAIFFRDDGLSDLIGFHYKDWRSEDAAQNFAHNITNIANFLGDEADEHVVSVILDGENAWEYYPDNAYQFLMEFYDVMSDHPRIEMTTFSHALSDGVMKRDLPVIRAGSWVYGSFSTWMGCKDKNKAWDLLVEVKKVYDKVVESDALTEEEVHTATEQLAICEGSDWFWWFGDYNNSQSVKDFDRLYRSHLKKLYQLLDQTPPVNLDVPISLGGHGVENAGTMRRNV